MPFVSIGGVTLHHRHIEAAGTSRPIIFINSLGTDFRIWDDVVAKLSGEMPMLVYDKRGHGLSDIGGGVRSIDDHADDLRGLIDHFGFDKVVLCGLSVGGMVAQRLYARRPELVEALILSDTAHKIGTAESWNTRIATVERDSIEAIADSVLKVWFTPEFHARRAADLAGCRNMLTRQALPGYIGTCMAVRDADFTDSARRIAVPTLCIVGDQDGSTPPDLVRSLAGLIPGARFEVIRNAAHIPCIEQPEALVTLIRDFVTSLQRENLLMDDVTKNRYRTGLEVRRSVLGNPHVDRAEDATTDFDRPFQQLIAEAAWGTVWARPGWSKRERSMVTLALLAALGHDEEVAMHVRATANTGASRDDICEAFLHVAIYAGVPAANRAFKIAKEVFAQMDGTSHG